MKDEFDLISMVKGTSPYYTAFENEIVKKAGRFTGGFADEWRWDMSALAKLSEAELSELYDICKNSWK